MAKVSNKRKREEEEEEEGGGEGEGGEDRDKDEEYEEDDEDDEDEIDEIHEDEDNEDDENEDEDNHAAPKRKKATARVTSEVDEECPANWTAGEHTVKNQWVPMVRMFSIFPVSIFLIGVQPIPCKECAARGLTCRVNFARGASCNRCQNSHRTCSLHAKRSDGKEYTREQAGYILWHWTTTATPKNPHPGDHVRPKFSDISFSPPNWWTSGVKQFRHPRAVPAYDKAPELTPNGKPRRRRFRAPTSSDDERAPPTKAKRTPKSKKRQAPKSKATIDVSDNEEAAAGKRTRQKSGKGKGKAPAKGAAPVKQGKGKALAEPVKPRSRRGASQRKSSTPVVESEDGTLYPDVLEVLLMSHYPCCRRSRAR